MKTLLADLLPLARKDPSVTRRVCSNAVSCIQIHYLSILINIPSKDRFVNFINEFLFIKYFSERRKIWIHTL